MKSWVILIFQQLPDISEIFESFNHFPDWPVMHGVKKKCLVQSR